MCPEEERTCLTLQPRVCVCVCVATFNLEALALNHKWELFCADEWTFLPVSEKPGATDTISRQQLFWGLIPRSCVSPITLLRHIISAVQKQTDPLFCVCRGLQPVMLSWGDPAPAHTVIPCSSTNTLRNVHAHPIQVFIQTQSKWTSATRDIRLEIRVLRQHTHDLVCRIFFNIFDIWHISVAVTCLRSVKGFLDMWMCNHRKTTHASTSKTELWF